jgi:putative transcriptional regulator
MKNLVRELRTERNMAQGQLAEAIGVSRQTINSIETGRYTPLAAAGDGPGRYFGVTVEEMFDDQDR